MPKLPHRSGPNRIEDRVVRATPKDIQPLALEVSENGVADRLVRGKMEPSPSAEPAFSDILGMRFRGTRSPRS
jgi:hypothetical protein